MWPQTLVIEHAREDQAAVRRRPFGPRVVVDVVPRLIRRLPRCVDAVRPEDVDGVDRGELVVQLGPFCVPCGKRFAKQTTYDAHLSGSKHLKALQKLGRVEEAMVCQIDVDAKRRKTQELEEARMTATHAAAALVAAAGAVASQYMY